MGLDRCWYDICTDKADINQSMENGITYMFLLLYIPGYAGDMGEQAVKLADIKPVKREKWWRKHPDVLRMKYGNRAKIPDPNVIRTR